MEGIRGQKELGGGTKGLSALAVGCLAAWCAVLSGCVGVSPDFGSKAFETEAGSLATHWKGPHIQGFACTPDAVYLGYQHGIFKYAWNGKLLKYVDTPCHTGDVCWYGGRLYTSVDILEGPRPSRSGVVQVYDADLNLIREKDIPQGVDGICGRDGVLYLGMNGPAGDHRGNQIGRMDAETLEFLGRIDIDHGADTNFGTQDIATDGENFWVSFYSKVPLAVFDGNWKLVRTLDFTANVGLDFLPACGRGKLPRLARGQNLSNAGGAAYRIEFFEFDGTAMRPVQ